MKRYTIEAHGHPGQYALYEGRDIGHHGLRLCNLLDFDARGDQTIGLLLDRLNAPSGCDPAARELIRALLAGLEYSHEEPGRHTEGDGPDRGIGSADCPVCALIVAAKAFLRRTA